jgi:hypothetical protein
MLVKVAELRCFDKRPTADCGRRGEKNIDRENPQKTTKKRKTGKGAILLLPKVGRRGGNVFPPPLRFGAASRVP